MQTPHPIATVRLDVRPGFIRYVARAFGRDPEVLDRALAAAGEGDPDALRDFGLLEVPEPSPGCSRSGEALDELFSRTIARQVASEAAALGVTPEEHLSAVLRAVVQEGLTVVVAPVGKDVQPAILRADRAMQDARAAFETYAKA